MPFYRSVLESSGGGGGGGGSSSPYITFTTNYDVPIIENIAFEYNYENTSYYDNILSNITKVKIGNAVSNTYYMFASSPFNANLDLSEATRLVNIASMMEHCEDFNSSIIFPNYINVPLPDEWSSLGVTYGGLFRGCTNYNLPTIFKLNDVSTADYQTSYVSLEYAFSDCYNFNAPVGFDFIKQNVNTEVANLSGIQYSCYGMFYNCNHFNQPMRFPPRLSGFEDAFENCYNFNQPVVFDFYGRDTYLSFKNLFKNIQNMCSDIVFLNSNYLEDGQSSMFQCLVNNNRTNTITIYIDNITGIKNNNLTGQGAITWTQAASPFGYTSYLNSAYKIEIIDNAQYGLDKFNNYYNNFYNLG